jgi:hypothetical protein
MRRRERNPESAITTMPRQGIRSLPSSSRRPLSEPALSDVTIFVVIEIPWIGIVTTGILGVPLSVLTAKRLALARMTIVSKLCCAALYRCKGIYKGEADWRAEPAARGASKTVDQVLAL